MKKILFSVYLYHNFLKRKEFDFDKWDASIFLLILPYFILFLRKFIVIEYLIMAKNIKCFFFKIHGIWIRYNYTYRNVKSLKMMLVYQNGMLYFWW